MTRRTNWSLHFVNLLLVAYWLVLFYLTHMQTNVKIGPGHTDKVLHFLAYAGLAFLLAWALCQTRGLSFSVCAFVISITTIYAITDELTQAFIPSRHADVWDAAADILGALTGLAAVAAIVASRNVASPSDLASPKSES